MKILCALFIFLAAPGISGACTCAFPTFDEQVKKATTIFTGKVLTVDAASDSHLRIDLQVKKRWKGISAKTISVSTPDDTAACGYPFELENEYLVYATGDKELRVGLCSRTRLLSDAFEDLGQLEKAFKKKEPVRDPFSDMKGDRLVLDQDIPRALNITNAVIVGITKKNDAFVALIRATNNKVYFLKVGDKLHDGVVLKIDSNSVTFRQYKGYRSVLVRKQLRPFPDDE